MTYVTHLPPSGGFHLDCCIGLEGIVACEDGLERMSVTTDAAIHDYVLSPILILLGWWGTDRRRKENGNGGGVDTQHVHSEMTKEGYASSIYKQIDPQVPGGPSIG